jgi:ribosomal protein S18 acetylase RimI-like enzyme
VILVREATADDLPRLGALFDAYRVFYGQPPNPFAAQFFMGERLKRADSKIFLAVDNEKHQSVGFVQLYPTFSSVRVGRLWILNDIFVREDMRRTGIANALVDAAEIFARSTNAVGLTLMTAHTNAAAQALYRKRGFTRDDEFVAFHKYFVEKT